MKVNYSHNNSGGHWWLSDDHWKALEAGGWTVNWCSEGRWLDAIAYSASREAETPADAIRDWERIVGMDASDEGCNCCGPPHQFQWGEGDKFDVVSGEEVSAILLNRPDITSLSRRELIERLAAKEKP